MVIRFPSSMLLAALLLLGSPTTTAASSALTDNNSDATTDLREAVTEAEAEAFSVSYNDDRAPTDDYDDDDNNDIPYDTELDTKFDDIDDDEDEIYPGDDDNGSSHHKDPFGDDDEKYGDDFNTSTSPSTGSTDSSNEQTKNIPFLSKPEEYITFKKEFNLRHDAVLELYRYSKTNDSNNDNDNDNEDTIFINNKHYSISNLLPMDIYTDSATYTVDEQQSSSVAQYTNTVYFGRQGTDVVIVSRHFDNYNYIHSVDIMGENGGDYHFESVESIESFTNNDNGNKNNEYGLLALIKSNDYHPDHVQLLKTLDMKGLNLTHEQQKEEVLPPKKDDSGELLTTKEQIYHHEFVLAAKKKTLLSREKRNRNRRLTNSNGCSEFKVIELAAVYDSTFCAQNGGHSQSKSKIESIVGKASMMYQRQGVCTKVKIKSTEGHCVSSVDPYKAAIDTGNIGCGGANGVLQGFSYVWKNKRGNLPRSSAHLFFAKDLGENTIGCAYIDVLCKKTYGYGVNNFDALSNTYQLAALFAHELGHNTGLNHVASDHNNPFVMGSHIGNGEHVWCSESKTQLDTNIPNAYCIKKESSGSTCDNTPAGWHDVDGTTYNCAWYSQGSNCDDYGNGWPNYGKNANQACCACGGGSSALYDNNDNDDEESKESTEGDYSNEDADVTCGCSSCTSDILDTEVDGDNGKTIRDHISWIVDNLNESEKEACELVCGEEFDDICGEACNPSQCN